MKIGFIGGGNVGGKLSYSLLRNGFDLMVRDLDKKVQRTRQRPIASGKISVLEALVYIAFLCLICI